MRKIDLIFILLFTVTGCSVLKIEKHDNIQVSKDILIEDIVNQNITNESFFISKADVEIFGEEGKEKIICSIKYDYPETYLISIRNRTGIEAVRLYITNDSIRLNDRINRKFYYGSGNQLLEKYGFSKSMIPIILGDYVSDDLVRTDPESCIDGLIKKQDIINGSVIKYNIDCRISKIVSTSTGSYNKINLKYSRFIRCNKKLIPGEIEIEGIGGMKKLIIRIEKLECPWDGKIEFIPGARYEQMPLL